MEREKESSSLQSKDIYMYILYKYLYNYITYNYILYICYIIYIIYREMDIYMDIYTSGDIFGLYI